MAKDAEARAIDVKYGRWAWLNRNYPLLDRLFLYLASETAYVHRPFLIGRMKFLKRDPELSQAACDALRDGFGNPFRPVAVDPAWRSATVLAIAQGVYEDKAFDRFPILTDALQDAGCADGDILSHLRGDGLHARGCWALDLVLGKS